jgi:hypothetical protein
VEPAVSVGAVVSSSRCSRSGATAATSVGFASGTGVGAGFGAGLRRAARGSRAGASGRGATGWGAERTATGAAFAAGTAAGGAAAATAAGRADVWGGFAGQGLGMVRAVRPAAEVLRYIVEGAERALERGPALLRG